MILGQGIMSRIRNRVKQEKKFLLNEDSISILGFSFYLVPVLLCVAPIMSTCFVLSCLTVLVLRKSELSLNK